MIQYVGSGNVERERVEDPSVHPLHRKRIRRKRLDTIADDTLALARVMQRVVFVSLTKNAVVINYRGIKLLFYQKSNTQHPWPR